MSAVLNKAGKKLFEKHLEQYAPADPLYEEYTNAAGKKKKRKRASPPGLSARDVRILKSVQRRAHYLDKGFRFCGMRFGWTFFIGLIPIVGDVTDISLNYYLVVRKARQADLPPWLVRRMLANNAVSAAVGFVPFAGDVVLAMFKANSRNAALLEEFLRIRGEEFLKLNAGGQVVEEANDGTKQSIFKRKRKEVVRSDMEQIVPGAGMQGAETVSAKSNAAVLPGPIQAGGIGESPSSNTTKSSGKKSFSFFGSGSRKAIVPPAGERGRFVEDVGQSHEGTILKN